MPASSLDSADSPIGLVARPRFVKSRTLVGKNPRFHNEKPYEQLVEETLGERADLKITQRLKLLEDADDRKIRRGDAIDFIESVLRKNAKKHRVTPRSARRTFAIHFAAFAAVYLVAAAAWCLVMGRWA
jgi:hypothetical protein